MAHKRIRLDQDAFSCSICLNLLKDPVTLPCGHNYCLTCIQTHWNLKNIHRCPQCRQTFIPRPVLGKNTMLADLVDQLKKTRPEPEDHCYAGAEDVSCDVCTERKLKAVKSCLVCLVSYCDTHLQPHYSVPQFKKHQLVDPSENLQENICSRHDEVMKIFCRTDQQCICYLCSMEEHKDHDTVSAAAEWTEKQMELEVSRQKIQQKIKHKQEKVKVLRQEAEAISHSADEAVKKSHQIITEMIQLMKVRRCDVGKKIKSQEETEVGGVKDLERKLEQEIRELRRRDAEMDKLSHTHHHNKFLLQYPSVCGLSEGPDSLGVHIRPRRNFENVTTAVSGLRDKLQQTLTEEWTHISLTITQPQLLLDQPQTRERLLWHSRQITLDPNTAQQRLSLSGDNKRVTFMSQTQNYSHHPYRFSDWCQVLSREVLTGHCYWEVVWSGREIGVAVAYKDIKRQGSTNECVFGFNDKSWSLHCNRYTGVFRFNGVKSDVSVPVSSRMGVYLDHTAGILSFYNVGEPMTLIHRVQTTFTQPLYAGLWLCDTGDTAHFPKLRQIFVFGASPSVGICL